MAEPRVVPPSVTQLIETYIDRQLEQAHRYDNRQPFDESGVFDLHRLAALIYVSGWSDGEQSQAERDRGQRRRERRAAELGADGGVAGA